MLHHLSLPVIFVGGAVGTDLIFQSFSSQETHNFEVLSDRSAMAILQVAVCSFILSRSLHSDDLEVLGFCVGWFLERVVVVISLDLDFWGVIDGMCLFIWVCGS